MKYRLWEGYLETKDAKVYQDNTRVCKHVLRIIRKTAEDQEESCIIR